MASFCYHQYSLIRLSYYWALLPALVTLTCQQLSTALKLDYVFIKTCTKVMNTLTPRSMKELAIFSVINYFLKERKNGKAL